MEVDITWNDKKEKIEFKKISFGNENDAVRKSIVPVMRDGDFVQEVDFVLQREYEMAYSIIKAPFKLTNVDDVRNNLRSLDKDEGRKAFNIFMNLNHLTESKKSELDKSKGGTSSSSKTKKDIS